MKQARRGQGAAGFLALALAATAAMAGRAEADVVYVRAGAVIEGLPEEPTAAGEFAIFRVTRMRPDPRVPGYDPNNRETWRAVEEWALRGRVVDVTAERSGAAPPALRVQLAKVHETGEGARRGRAIEWLLPVVTVPLRDVTRIDHDVDSIQDLRWAFSNRDDLVAQASGQSVVMGDRVWAETFLAAIQGRERVSGGAVPLREGWLVRLLRDGPLTPAARERAIMNERLSGAGFSSLALEPTGRVADGVLQVDIRPTVRALLEAAARDRVHSQSRAQGRYGTYYGNPRPTGPGGLFYGHGRPFDGRTHPIFYEVVKGVVNTLCSLARFPGDDARAARIRACGVQAREAVIEALEAARVGSLAPGDSDRVLGQSLSEASDDPAVRAHLVRQAHRVRPAAQRAAAEIPNLAAILPLDPSVVALVALDLIAGNDEWRVPREDIVRALRADRAIGEEAGIIAAEREGALRLVTRGGSVITVPDAQVLEVRSEAGRLVRALVQLARDADDADQARAGDRFRRPEQVSANAFDPFFGAPSQLKIELVKSLRWLIEVGDPLPRWAPAGLGPENAPVRDLPSASDVYRRHLAPLLAEGDAHERQFARTLMATVGFGDRATLEEVVERLFRIAVGSTEETGHRLGGITERDVLRQRMRDDAVVTLSRLGSLAYMPRDAGEREIGHLVLERIDALLDAEAEGHSAEEEREFFELVGRIAGQDVAQNPSTLLEQRRAFARDHARALVRRQQEHLTDMRRTIEQDARRLDPRSPTFPSQRAELERQQGRAEALRERLAGQRR